MSSKWKDLAKNGWHPEKEGTSLRGQMKSLVGRGDPAAADRANHVAAPISSLRDPASFAPPPKRDPSQAIPSPSSPYAPALPSSTSRPGPPAPPARSQQSYSSAVPQDEGLIEAEPRAPPKKWQLDSTGLSTAHLPPPPGRTDGADGRSAPLARTASPAAITAPGTIANGPPPSLPPRLPPRSGTNSPVRTASPSLPSRSAAPTPEPPRAENGFLNQGAASRLGAAGISVPGFGIGNKTSPAPPPRSPASASPAPAASQGTTWQQKQAALKTASQFHKDPSTVSFSDAKAAASTANNFRQRHGEQVAGGIRTANSLGQKFGYSPTAQAGTSPSTTPGVGGTQQPPESERSMSVRDLASAIGKKKPPAPPPPRKKPELSAPPAPGGRADAPPPVPMSTRPTF